MTIAKPCCAFNSVICLKSNWKSDVACSCQTREGRERAEYVAARGCCAVTARTTLAEVNCQCANCVGSNLQRRDVASCVHVFMGVKEQNERQKTKLIGVSKHNKHFGTYLLFLLHFPHQRQQLGSVTSRDIQDAKSTSTAPRKHIHSKANTATVHLCQCRRKTTRNFVAAVVAESERRCKIETICLLGMVGDMLRVSAHYCLLETTTPR